MLRSNFALQIDTRLKLKRNRRFAFLRATAVSLLAIGSLGMTGCVRGVTETTVAPTGTWTRKITFHGVKPDPNGGFTMGQKIEDAVTLPQGPEWKITRKEENDEQVITAERSLPQNATAKEIANQFLREFMLAMFGPNSPMVNEMAGLMAQPELMERRMMVRMASRLETLLKTRFGEQVKPEQRTALIHDMVQVTLHIVNNKSKASGPGAPPNPNGEENSSGMLSLFLSVKLPGRITETNGEQDPVKHDVYWAFYPPAAALGDIKLTATCDTNK